MDVSTETKQDHFPGQIHELPGGGIVLSKLDDVINWARSNSLWPLTFATSCCGIEYMSVAGAKYDFFKIWI
jgi:NADH-quinone oxidoreductase subunit B